MSPAICSASPEQPTRVPPQPCPCAAPLLTGRLWNGLRAAERETQHCRHLGNAAAGPPPPPPPAPPRARAGRRRIAGTPNPSSSARGALQQLAPPCRGSAACLAAAARASRRRAAVVRSSSTQSWRTNMGWRAAAARGALPRETHEAPFCCAPARRCTPLLRASALLSVLHLSRWPLAPRCRCRSDGLVQAGWATCRGKRSMNEVRRAAGEGGAQGHAGDVWQLPGRAVWPAPPARSPAGCRPRRPSYPPRSLRLPALLGWQPSA